jgi:hypothetical protein
MAAPGQRVLRHGPSWVELGYAHEGQAWRQTHRLAAADAGRLCLVTAQAPEAHFAAADRAAEEVADSVAPFEG